MKKSTKLIQPQVLNKMINPNPKAPTLRTNTKIHKINNPVRPIVNYTQAPAYKIKKFLNKYLKQKLIIRNNYNIQNSKHLTTLLKSVPINKNSKIISLDIRDMYTNIPVKETLNIIQNQTNLLCDDIDESDQLISLLETSLEQNYFMYNNEFYLQKDGLPMGSPISSLLSEIFLQNLESQFIENIKTKHNISFYGHYVDDILIVYNQTDENQSQNILNDFNNIHNSLKFTLEEEACNGINYLDLNLTKNCKKNPIQYLSQTHNIKMIDK